MLLLEVMLPHDVIRVQNVTHDKISQSGMRPTMAYDTPRLINSWDDCLRLTSPAGHDRTRRRLGPAPHALWQVQG